MYDLSRKYEAELKKLAPDAQEAARETHEFVSKLSKGDAELTDPILGEIDRLNQRPVDVRDDKVMCPGAGMDQLFDNRPCLYLQCDQCQFLSDIKKFPKRSKANANIVVPIPGIGIELPKEYKQKIVRLIMPSAWFDIFKAYDQCIALEMRIKAFEKSGVSKLLTPKAAAEQLASLKAASEEADRRLNRILNIAYQFALRGFFGHSAPSEKEFRDIYEEKQYMIRLSLGEPVIFKDGRCWFEGYVASQGYLPGAFPGLEFWTKNGEQVDAKRFAQWLTDVEPERERSNLPLVGYSGHPVCGVYALDILKYFAGVYDVFGSETFGFITLKATP